MTQSNVSSFAEIIRLQQREKDDTKKLNILMRNAMIEQIVECQEKHCGTSLTHKSKKQMIHNLERKAIQEARAMEEKRIADFPSLLNN